MPAAFPPPPQANWRLAAAYLLFGFGGSLCAPPAFIMRLVFLPGRGGARPLAPFSFDHPLAVVCEIMLGLGAALLLWGWRLLETAWPKSRDFGSARANW